MKGRLMEKLLIHDVRAKGYLPYQVQGPHAGRYRNAFEYIDRLASITQTNITDWNLNEFINPGSANRYIHTEKQDINRIFYNMLANRPKPEVKAGGLSAEAVKDIKNLAKKMVNGDKNIIKASIRSYISRIESSALSINSCHKEIKLLNERLVNAENRNTDSLLTELERVQSDGFFFFDTGYSDNAIKFKTQPITLNYVNQAQSVNCTRPMGTFEVVLNVLDFKRIKVKEDKNNLYTTREGTGLNPGYYHPHVSQSGNVCWGNGTTRASKLHSEGKFYEFMMLLKQVLNEYCHDNPYHSLPYFRYSLEGKQLFKATEDNSLEVNDSSGTSETMNRFTEYTASFVTAVDNTAAAIPTTAWGPAEIAEEGEEDEL